MKKGISIFFLLRANLKVRRKFKFIMKLSFIRRISQWNIVLSTTIKLSTIASNKHRKNKGKNVTACIRGNKAYIHVLFIDFPHYIFIDW